MAAARNTCLTWRCIDDMHEMTRGCYNGAETKMSLAHISWCETNGYSGGLCISPGMLNGELWKVLHN